MTEYRVAGYITNGGRRFKWCVENAPVHDTINQVCMCCASDRIMIKTVGKRPTYYWVERHSRTVIAEFTARYAAEMAGYMLAGN